MGSRKDIDYRLALARGFLEEAELDYSLKRWRASVSGSILVVENTGVAVLMLFGVSPLTHKPGCGTCFFWSECWHERVYWFRLSKSGTFGACKTH